MVYLCNNNKKGWRYQRQPNPRITMEDFVKTFQDLLTYVEKFTPTSKKKQVVKKSPRTVTYGDVAKLKAEVDKLAGSSENVSHK